MNVSCTRPINSSIYALFRHLKILKIDYTKEMAPRSKVQEVRAVHWQQRLETWRTLAQVGKDTLHVWMDACRRDTAAKSMTTANGLPRRRDYTRPRLIPDGEVFVDALSLLVNKKTREPVNREWWEHWSTSISLAFAKPVADNKNVLFHGLAARLWPPSPLFMTAS